MINEPEPHPSKTYQQIENFFQTKVHNCPLHGLICKPDKYEILSLNTEQIQHVPTIKKALRNGKLSTNCLAQGQLFFTELRDF